MGVRTIFIGSGAFAVPALRALAAAADVVLIGVVTAPARPAGRHGNLRPSPIADAARDLGIAVVQAPERLRRPEAIADVLALRPELVVLADYGQVVPRALLDLPHGALNLHPSLLPRHRGASPIPATILGGDARTGVTLMRMDDGLDTGPIVAVDDAGLRGDEIAPDLERDLADRGADLLRRSLSPWIRGEITPAPQASSGATLTRPLRRDDGRLDPELPALILERQVRALQPWPGTWFDVPTGRITIWRAALAPGIGASSASSGEPGSDVAAELPQPGEFRAAGGGLLLATSGGALDLQEVQPAGGRRMSGVELLRGRPALLLERVESPPPALQPGPIERPVG